MEPREFKCIDCGSDIVSFGDAAANDQPICATCLWVRDVEKTINDPGELERFRQTLRRFRGFDKGE